MKEIKLTNSSTKVTYVDDEDFEYLNQFTWRLNRQDERAYIIRSERISLGKAKTTHMHREIMRPDPFLEIDHIDGNRLNNTKNNLRICTKAENVFNKKKIKGTTSSKFKGVSWHPSSKKWRAQIVCNKRRYSLGLYYNEVDAAKAYDKAARFYHKEFCSINFKELK